MLIMANKIYKLKIEEGPSDEYFIAIHSTLEAYQLAYHVNKQNKILLKRKKDFFLSPSSPSIAHLITETTQPSWLGAGLEFGVGSC